MLDREASFVTKILEVAAGKCGSQVGDDAIWQGEPVDDVIKQLDCLICSSLNEGFVLDPLGELVNAT
jgi:hypothetical protein